MSKDYTVAVLVGSLREQSYSRKTAQALESVAPANLKFKYITIGDLPFYNEDLETANPPAEWTRFRQDMSTVDAVLFVTPEYNRSIPATIKNAIDVGSRPWGKSIWPGKPAAVVSISQGGVGGFGANHQLRQALVFGDMPVMQQPEAYIGSVQNVVTDDGKPANDSSTQFLTSIMKTFDAWIQKILA